MTYGHRPVYPLFVDGAKRAGRAERRGATETEFEDFKCGHGLPYAQRRSCMAPASYNRFARNTIGPARINTDTSPWQADCAKEKICGQFCDHITSNRKITSRGPPRRQKAVGGLEASK